MAVNIREIAQKVQDWRKTRASIRELAKLSDRELADLGITRGDIEFVTKGGVRH